MLLLWYVFICFNYILMYYSFICFNSNRFYESSFFKAIWDGNRGLKMKMIKQYKGGSYGNYSKFRCNDGEEKNEC